MARRLGLGRGLSALIPDRSADRPKQPTPDDADGPAGAVPHTGQSTDRSTGEAALDRIHPNPRQPRSEFSASELEQLATTIRTHGVIQPLLVAAQPDGDYQLIAGERRWRAARLAGLTSVPITVREVSDQELLELAIVENVQRQDLNPLEEADAYRRLIEDFHLTQRQVGERVGRSRATIANTLRLLELPEDLRASLAAREITEGHARALLGASTPEGMHKAWRQLLGRRLKRSRHREAGARTERRSRTPRGRSRLDSPGRANRARGKRAGSSRDHREHRGGAPAHPQHARGASPRRLG